MKRWFLFITLGLGLVLSTASFAQNKNVDEVQRKSSNSIKTGAGTTTFPVQFNETNVLKNGPNRAVSTGYYFVDVDDAAPEYWRPNVEFVDTTTEPGTWRRITQGPRILPKTYWEQNPGEGLRFFRNPAQPNFFESVDIDGNPIPVDSTYDAIAGPMAIGFGFYFNGIRYDSFYVSTNGVIALTNRRYFYNSQGEKVIPPGATSAYDPMSMDWYARPVRTATGLDDNTPDDFGYQYSVLNNAPASPTAGIRSSGGPLNTQSSTTNRGAYIAPLWGQNHLSQWNPFTNLPDDHGKVYFKREFDASRLTLYFVNIAPQAQGTVTFVNGQWTISTSDRRPGTANYVSANVQVVLNRVDSSVTFLYLDFKGTYPTGGGSRPTAGPEVFATTSVSGVTGWARHTNFNSKTGVGTYPWGADEYQQTTHYFAKENSGTRLFPFNDDRVRFKQWKNSVRVVDIQYKVRKQEANTDLKFTETIPTADANNYELLAGEERIGALQPIALIQNMTNDIQGPQGVNYTPQDVNFVARFRILNLATYDEVIQWGEKKRIPAPRIIYNRLVNISETCLNLPDEVAHPDCQENPYNRVRYSTVTKTGANYNATNIVPLPTGWNGIPPYNYVQVYFPPFEPNEFAPDHSGRMRAFIIADAHTSPIPSQPALGGDWPFDDTASVSIIVMNRLKDFTDDLSTYHDIERTQMPSVYKWVNIGAVTVGGDIHSRNPLPPRDNFKALNNSDIQLNSPIIQMNRLDLDNSDFVPQSSSPPNGDKITSFPIDIRGKIGSVLSFSIQRTDNAPYVKWDRGWTDNRIIGCEPRIVTDVNIPFNTFANNNSVGKPNPDSLIVEIMKPSPDGIKNITNNNALTNWRWHPKRPSAQDPFPTAFTKYPAFALFGGGGYFIGWDEKNRNEPLEVEKLPDLNGLRANIFDDGIDWEFQRFAITIPDTFVTSPAEGGKNFRFRIRVSAHNHNKCQTCIPDDDDDFFVDNVRILFPSSDNITDIEVNSVKILWPYEMAPASQATEIPVRVVINNNTSIISPTFRVKVKIYQGQTTQSNPIYCKTWTVPSLGSGRSLEVPLPTWNARKTGPGTYRMQAIVILPGGDLEPKNDTTYSDVTLTFGDAFAYDDISNVSNSVPDFTTEGAGLSLFGNSYGGTGTPTSYNSPAFVMGGNGANSGSGSGQIAVRFTMLNTDTIYGFQAYFAELNQAMDDISWAIYRSNDRGDTPANLYPNSEIIGYRGLTTPVIQTPKFKEYITYKLTDFNKQPIVLNKGVYWLAIGQMGLDGLHLGASKHRMGMRTTVQSLDPQTNLAGPFGRQFMIDKQYRVLINNSLDNYNFFSYENVRKSGTWNPFMPSVGNPAYAHLHHYGTSPSDNVTLTFSRGSWVPMIRPYFGFKTSGDNTDPEFCPDDIPVELVSFRGDVRTNAGIDIYWETASETRNYGFYVEKRKEGEGETSWNSIAFIPGGNNSSTVRHYNFTDKDVKLNQSYQYRLRQVDFDGTQYCNTSDIITKTYDLVSELTLIPNSPNPFSGGTKIEFNMPESGNARLEVIDVYGNTVNVLLDKDMNRGYNSAVWDGRDASGTVSPAGTYIYRLTTGDKVLSGKMTIIR